jgi:hypothetical protein
MILESLRKSARGRAGGGFFGIVEEIFAPTRHESRIELERQAEMSAPSPESPDRDDHDAVETEARYAGRIRIEIPPST